MTLKFDIIRRDMFGEFHIITNLTKIEELKSDNALKFHFTYMQLDAVKSGSEVWPKEQIFKMELIP